MNETDLHLLIDSWENLHLIVDHFSDHPELLDDLINITLDDSRPKSWRAAWMIDRIHEKRPELALPYLPRLTKFVLTTKNEGKRRHLLKLISLNEISEEDEAIFLNYSISIFTDATIPIAVRVHAMQILFNIAQKETDFTGELIDLIEHEIEFHGSAGITSRGQKLLKKLYQMEK